MTDRPIIFSAPMVKALLDGRKTQDRRVLKGVPDQPAAKCHPSYSAKHPAPYLDAYCGEKKTLENPRGMSTMWNWWQVDDRMCWPQFKVSCTIGDRLWVREAWAHDEPCAVQYRAGPHAADDAVGVRWRSPIHMPRWASRLTLIVTDVRVQRLQDISEDDAVAEGCRPFFDETDTHILKGPNGTEHKMMPLKGPADAFRNLWNSLHGPNAWDENPWVAALTFTVQRGNIDQIGGA